MANPEHLRVVEGGPPAIRAWRESNPGERLNLARANLGGADLGGANLGGTDLRWATLGGANLREANLGEADLREANLREANLRGADLREADLFGANLFRANLREAHLGADLREAHLYGANLREADLARADLRGADLAWANLGGADLSGAQMGVTLLCRCDLSSCRGLESVEHPSPSSIGVDTLIMTLQGAGGQFTKEQLVFFEKVGVPGSLLEYLPGLIDLYAIRLYSVFIGHGGDAENLALANRLYDALKERGVDCWMYERDALIGRHPWAQIDVAMRQFDKVLVLCSEASLKRPGVRREIDRALAREDDLVRLSERLKDEARAAGRPAPLLDTDVLFPIRLDDAIFTWEHHRRVDILNAHHVGDFTGWRDSERFNEALERLLVALNPRSWPSPEERRATPPAHP